MEFTGRVKRTLAYIGVWKTIHPPIKELMRRYHQYMVLSAISTDQQKRVAHYKIIAGHEGHVRFVNLDKSGPIKTLNR